MSNENDVETIVAAANWHALGASKMALDALNIGVVCYLSFVFFANSDGTSVLLAGMARIAIIAAFVLLAASLARLVYAGFLMFQAKKLEGGS